MQNRDTEAANETVEPLLLPSESFTSNQKSKRLATQQNGDPEASKETTEPFALPDGFATQKSADVVFSAITVFFCSIDSIHGAMKKKLRDQLAISLFSTMLALHVAAIIIHFLFLFMDTLRS